MDQRNDLPFHIYHESHKTLFSKADGVVSLDLPPEYGTAAELNERLQKMMRLVEDILSFCLKNTRDNPMFFLKKNFSPDLDITTLEQRKEKTGSLDVYDQFDAYIESKKRRIAPATVNIYMEVKRYLQAFEKFRGRKITFKSFDVDFYHEFIEFKIQMDHLSFLPEIILH